jgi:hypothetical protein
MTVDFNSITIYAKLQGNLGEWTDVSSDICHSHPISYTYGIRGNSVNDRVADTGEMTLCFDNSENNSAGLVGYYSPGNTNCRSGFAAGLQIKLVAVYENDTKTLFYGRIPPNGIKPQPLRYGERKTLVTVLDWMEQAAIHEIDLPEYTTNKTAAEVGTLIVANMPIAPMGYELSDCEFTFPYVFDTLKGGHTKAMSEFQKASVSEQGRVYIKHDKFSDEILAIEGKNTRSNTLPTDEVAKPTNLCGFLLMETGEFLLQETGDKIILDETIPLDLEDEMKTATISHGEEIITTAKSVCYPRKIDAAANTTLFNLDKVIEIDAGETISGLRGRFRDPDGAATYVTGLNVVATVGTTHYLMNAASAGTGTDMTSLLALTVEIGSDSINYGTITNTGTVTGYITKLCAIGKGVYTYDPITYVAESDTAKSKYGSYVVSLDMKYQDDPTFAAALTNIIVARKSDPKTMINSVTFTANRSFGLMGAFMLCDIGTRVRLTETVSGVDEDYFINGLGAKIYNMRVAEYTWYVSRAADDIYQFWELETAGRSELGVTTYLGY